jgi:hypothetical protein
MQKICFKTGCECTQLIEKKLHCIKFWFKLKDVEDELACAEEDPFARYSSPYMYNREEYNHIIKTHVSRLRYIYQD